jgi:predicted acetyltransferase
MDIILIKPTLQYAEDIAAYRKEFLADGSSMDGCGSLKNMENPADWLRQVEDLSKAETLPANWVIATQFICVRASDNRIVGMIQVRHYFNEFLEKYAGHIGYSVRPSER